MQPVISLQTALSVTLVVLLAAGCGTERQSGTDQSAGAGGGEAAGGGAEGGDGKPAGQGDGDGDANGQGEDDQGEGDGGQEVGGEGEGEADGGDAGEDEGAEDEGAEDEGGEEDELICPSGHAPGELFCHSATVRNQWDPECAFPFELPCDRGTVCHPATAECVPPVCDHNTSHCKDQHTREFCNETGSDWLPPAPCAEGLICVESVGNAICSPVVCQPGTVDCRDDETVQVCNDNGTDWVYEPCGQGQSCDEDDHSCKDRICDPDASRCDDNDPQVLWVCDERGISEEELRCPADRTCVDGACE